MYWLFGDIKNIRGNFADFSHKDLTDFEDSGVVTFDFINGGMGCLNYSTSVWDTNLESSITIIGSKGTVKVAGQYMQRLAKFVKHKIGNIHHIINWTQTDSR